MKKAELKAESNLRQSCLPTITECVRNACQADLAGTGASMDACLAQPEMARSFCKVELEPCERMDAGIWDFVVAKLAAMRVDACTEEVKSCFKNENRCGENYTNCIGLDLEALKEMCPLDALQVCTKSGSIKSWDDGIAEIVQGIFLNVDNSLMEECQNLIEEKMEEVCGSTTECNALTTSSNMGTGSLRSNKVEEKSEETKTSTSILTGEQLTKTFTISSNNYVVAGLIQFGNIGMKIQTESGDKANMTDEAGNSVMNGNGTGNWYEVDIESYLNSLAQNGEIGGTIAGIDIAQITDVIRAELESINGQINKVMQIFVTDPKISMCINGRDMTQISGANEDGSSNITTARFPNLLQSVSATIVNSAIQKATENYNNKFNEVFQKASQDAAADVANYMCIQMAEGSGTGAGKGDGNVTINRYAIEIPTGIDAKALKVVSDKKTVQDTEQTKIVRQTTWEATTRTCKLTTWTTTCERKSYGFAYMRKKTVCGTPVEKTEDIKM
jgi:hypothetical protein